MKKLEIKRENFLTFLRKEREKNKSISIVDILMNNDFMLIDPYDDGNNYQHFVDDNGILRFNNPDMQLDGNHVTSGCINEDGDRGNTLRFSNLYICNIAEKKEAIVESLIEIEKQFKELEDKKKELNEKLGYLLFINSDLLSPEAYAQFKKEEVTKNLKKTSIAEVKV